MHPELTPHDYAAHLVPRHLVWARVEQFGPLPLSEYERMGGHEALKMARNHVDPTVRMPREAAARILGELELDRVAPRWGEHLAWLRGDPDAVQVYAAPVTYGAWITKHMRMRAAHGRRLLAELGL